MPDDPNLLTRIARSIGDTYTNLSQGRNYWGQPMFPPGTSATPVFIPGGPVGEAAGVIPRAGLQGLEAPVARTVGLGAAQAPSPQVESPPSSPTPPILPKAEPYPEAQPPSPVARQLSVRATPTPEAPVAEPPVARNLAPTPAAPAPFSAPESPVNTAAIRTKPVEPSAEPPPVKQTPETATTASHPELAAEPQPLSWAERASQNLQDTADAAMERIRQRGTFTGARAPSMPVDDIGDLALWGSAKMAKGVVDSGRWSREMVKEFGPQIKPKLQEIYDLAEQHYNEQIARFGEKLPNLARLLDLYKKGIAGKDWYNMTQAELNDVFGKDTPMFLKFLAATSPNNAVASNVTQALKAYMQWKNGEPFAATATQKGYMPIHIELLNKAVNGIEFESPKVKAFNANLTGDPMPVTVDMWIAKAVYGKDSVTENQFKFADYLITQVAQKKGVPPREMQAAIWKAVRDEAGKKGGESFDVLLKKRFAKDPDFQSVLREAASRPAPPRP